MNNTYYELISMGESESAVYDNYMDIKDEVLAFSESEINHIKKIFPEIPVVTEKRWYLNDSVEATVKFPAGVGKDIVQIGMNLDHERFIMIYKLPDEWYIVDHNVTINFKCDQIDGVIKLINDILDNTETFVVGTGTNRNNNYIKMFTESLGEVYPPIKRISQQEADRWMDEKSIDKLNKTDISIIEDSISGIPGLRIRPGYTEYSLESIYKTTSYKNNTVDYTICVYISKYKDEYYFCSINEREIYESGEEYEDNEDDIYYLCDQEEGLSMLMKKISNLIKDILSGKNNGCWLLEEQ